MQRHIHHHERASALIITMFLVFLTVAAIALAMTLTTDTMRLTNSSRDESALRSAAEGALDFGYGIWAKSANNSYGPPTKAQLATGMMLVPSFPGFTYAPTPDGPVSLTSVDAYGEPTTASYPTPTLITLDSYPGWMGSNYSYVARVRMSGTFAGGRPVTYGLKRTMHYSFVPLFQATAFFEGDLELYKAATMTIGGLVHTNSKAYVSSSDAGTLTFSGHLSYAAEAGYLPKTDPPQSNTWNGWSPNSELLPTFSNGGVGQQVAQVSRIEPLGVDSAALLHPPLTDNGSSTGDLSPNDDSMRELIEPPVNTATYPDPTPIASRRLYNKAGIRIHVAVAKNYLGSNVYTETVTIQNGTTYTSTQLATLKTTLTNALTQQTIYDRREGQYVDLSTLDLGAVRATLNDAVSAHGFNSIIYVDQTNSSGTISATDEQGIRIKNGGTLPTDGLTIASQNPVYIQGNLNTTSASTRGSAAIFADAVTILSNSWNDTYSTSSLSQRNASDTTVNAAIVAGFVPSGWTNYNTVPAYGYSGGLNNFPRFLEDWSGNKFTYSGSMIALFTSKIAIGEWDTGNIYAPPNRIWDFDSNFVNNPPPGSLDAVSIGRGALTRF